MPNPLRLLLVTLLTVAVASTTLLTTTSESPDDVTNLNATSFTTPAIIVEVATGPTNGTITADNATDKTVEWVDLSGQDKAQNNLSPNDTKIETNAVGGDAPKMVLGDDDNEDDDKEAVIRPIPIDTDSLEEEDDDDLDDSEEEDDSEVDDEDLKSENSTASATSSESPTTTTSRTTTTTRISIPVTKKPVEKSTKLPEKKDSNELEGYVLPTDDYEKVDFFENVNVTSTDIYDVPMTFWERICLFVQAFTHEHTKTSILILAILFTLVVLLALLVIRECCKKRRSHYRQHRLTSITADLYNTSSCSHRYEKVILPDNKEVTMQLMSADNSTDMV